MGDGVTAVAHRAPVRLAVSLSCFILLSALWLVPPLYVGAAAAAVALLVLSLRYPRYPLVGFCLLAFSVPWASGLALTVSSFPVSPTDGLIAAIGAAWLASVARSRRNPIVTGLWTPYIALFVAAIALSAGQAADTHASLREIVKWLELAVVYLAGVRFVETEREIRIVVASVVAAGVSQALLGYLQFAFQLGPSAFVHGAFLRAYGTFDQPNPYAGYLNMVLPLALAMALRGARGRERLGYAAAVAVLVGALLASESRGALLGTGLASVVILAVLSRDVYRLAWLGVLALLTGGWLASLGLVPISPFQRLLDTVGLGGVSFGNVTDANFSAVERAAHWLAGVRMFAAHPLLGVGIGNYADAYPAYHPRGWYAPLAHAHNYYINIAAEAGIIGLSAYLLLMGSAVWYSCETLRRDGNSLRWAAVLGVLGALVATNFHNLFDVLYVHGTVALLGMLMALVAGSLRVGNTPAVG